MIPLSSAEYKNQLLPLKPISTAPFDFQIHHKLYCRHCKLLGYVRPSLRTHTGANIDDCFKYIIKMR